MPNQYLMLWKLGTKGYRWPGFDDAVARTAKGEIVDWPWNIRDDRTTAPIRPGDRAFLYRLKPDYGIVGSGTFTSGPRIGRSFKDESKSAEDAAIEWDVLVSPADRLPRHELQVLVPELGWKHLQGYDVMIPPHRTESVSAAWNHHLDWLQRRWPGEFKGHETVTEGAVTTVLVNTYERSPEARTRCIARYGDACSVCTFRFEERYGQIGRGFIHVHHLRELSSVGAAHEIDPVRDLRPVCPNCHAMLHRRTPAFSIEELVRLLDQNDPLFRLRSS